MIPTSLIMMMLPVIAVLSHVVTATTLSGSDALRISASLDRLNCTDSSGIKSLEILGPFPGLPSRYHYGLHNDVPCILTVGPLRQLKEEARLRSALPPHPFILPYRLGSLQAFGNGRAALANDLVDVQMTLKDFIQLAHGAADANGMEDVLVIGMPIIMNIFNQVIDALSHLHQSYIKGASLTPGDLLFNVHTQQIYVASFTRATVLYSDLRNVEALLADDYHQVIGLLHSMISGEVVCATANCLTGQPQVDGIIEMIQEYIRHAQENPDGSNPDLTKSEASFLHSLKLKLHQSV